MNAASPMTARQTRLFAPICRNYDKDLPVEEAYDFNLKIFEEDRLIVENQKPEFYRWTYLWKHISGRSQLQHVPQTVKEKGFSPLFAA